MRKIHDKYRYTEKEEVRKLFFGDLSIFVYPFLLGCNMKYFLRKAFFLFFQGIKELQCVGNVW